MHSLLYALWPGVSFKFGQYTCKSNFFYDFYKSNRLTFKQELTATDNMRKQNVLPNFTKHTKFIPALAVFIALTSVFSSCSVTKPSEYFKTLQQKDTTLKNFVSNDFESKIMKGDKLSIMVSSLSPAEDALFNSAGAGSGTAGTSAAGSFGGYMVEQDGTVMLHRLGKVKAEGYTRREFARQTETLLVPYMKEPIVQVSYLNHKVTVLGAVTSPKVIELPEEQISLIDAIVMSGDMIAGADRKTVTVIREEGTEKKIKHINLENHSVFTSPWYYLKPNDIVVVNADYAKIDKEEKRRNLQTTLSLVASGVSLLIIILDRVIK